MTVLYLTFVVVLIDQVSKFMVKGGTLPLLNIHIQGMDYGSSINVFGDFFKITFVENPGLAFGIDVNETSKLFLSIFTLLATIGIFFYLYKSRSEKLIVRVALALILGGAIGNLIDRTFYGVFYGYAPIFYGKVVDFFNADFFDFTLFGRTYDRFPIFNVADSSVTIGVILLLLFHRTEKKIETENKLDTASTVESSSVTEKIEETNSTSIQIENDQNSNGKEN